MEEISESRQLINLVKKAYEDPVFGSWNKTTNEAHFFHSDSN